jgi:hypothetical protein
MISTFIIWLIAILLLAIGIFFERKNLCIFSWGLIIAGFFVVVERQIDRKPTAMDVYQGKTTLEITYKDGVAIDSVVVFKDKEKQQ